MFVCESVYMLTSNTCLWCLLECLSVSVMCVRLKRALLKGHFCYNVHPRVHQGELETRTGTRLPEVKALWVGGNPSCWIYALLTVFKSQLDTRKREETWDQKQGGECCCCWAEWKIIWCNKWYVRTRPAHDSHWVCACMRESVHACICAFQCMCVCVCVLKPLH